MKVLIVEPNKSPYVSNIDDSLEALQKVVSGDIEAIYPYTDKVAIICNEEGKLRELPLNRVIYDRNGKPIDVIAGTFFMVGLGEEDFTELSPELIKKYSDLFNQSSSYIV